MNRKYIVLIFFLLCGKFFSQSTDNKILFLDFKFVNGEPTLVGMKAVEGKLKTRKHLTLFNYGIELTTLSSSDKVLYQNTIENPSQIIYEYPAGNGKIGRTSIKQETVNVTLRVPYSPAIEKVRLNVLDTAKQLNKSSAFSNKRSYEFTIDHNKISSRK